MFRDVCLSSCFSTFQTRSLSFSSRTFTHLLLTLEESDLLSIMNDESFPYCIIEECIVQSITYCLARQNSNADYTSVFITPFFHIQTLLKACVDKSFAYIKKYLNDEQFICSDSYNAAYIARGLIWLVLMWSQVLPTVVLTEEMTEDCLEFARKFLESVYETFPVYDSIALETALDLCSVVSCLNGINNVVNYSKLLVSFL